MDPVGTLAGKGADELKVKLYPLGDAAVIIEVGDSIDLETHQKVKALTKFLDEHPFPGLVEYVPAFTTVTLFYDPVHFSDRKEIFPYDQVCKMIQHKIAEMESYTEGVSRTIEIPVCYGGEFGPDLEFVADYNGLSPQEVIDIHSSGQYLVYMIGFAPGFPYLGGMSENIAAPRRASPRLAIPAGTVGIAGNQTGVYPIETPGGWQLIGRTPMPLFKPEAESPSLLQAGDHIRFVPITAEEYLKMKEGQA